MKCTLLCPAVVRSHHSLSPFSPFTGAIHCTFLYIAQVISKFVSLYQGAFVGVVRSPDATCFRCCHRHRHQPCINTMTQGSHLTSLLYVLNLEEPRGASLAPRRPGPKGGCRCGNEVPNQRISQPRKPTLPRHAYAPSTVYCRLRCRRPNPSSS